MNGTNTKNEPNKHDMGSLINAIMQTVDANPYATPEIFKAGVEGVVRGYLRGKGAKFTPGSVMRIVRDITASSYTRKDRPSIWWKDWMERTMSLKKTRRTRHEAFGGRIWRHLPKWLRPTTYKVDGDVTLLVTGEGQQVILVRDMSLIGAFDTPQELRELALALMDTVSRLEDEHSVIEMDEIPDTYADTAITEWEERVRWGITGSDEPGA